MPHNYDITNEIKYVQMMNKSDVSKDTWNVMKERIIAQSTMCRGSVRPDYIKNHYDEAETIFYTTLKKKLTAFLLARWFSDAMYIIVVCADKSTGFARPLIWRAFAEARVRGKVRAFLYSVESALKYYPRFGFIGATTGNANAGWLHHKNLTKGPESNWEGTSKAKRARKPSSRFETPPPNVIRPRTPTVRPSHMKPATSRKLTHFRFKELNNENIVWVKFGTFRWWPALMLSVTPDKTRVTVMFFGDNKTGTVMRKKIKPWTEENYALFVKPGKRQHSLLAAIKAAEAYDRKAE